MTHGIDAFRRWGIHVRRLGALLAAAALFPCVAIAQISSPLADSLLAAAESLRAQGQRSSADSAVIRIRRAITLAPTSRAHAQMADAFAHIYSLRRTERTAYDSALFHAAAALGRDPRNTLAIFAKASAEGSAGDHAARLAGYERVLAIDSTFERGVGLLITAYADAGRDREAIALGERMRRLQPRNAQARFRLGWQYGFLWDQRKAITLFRELARDTTAGVYRSWANGELAYLARARGDIRATVRHMEDGVRAVPGDRVSRLGLAMMLLTDGKAARARPLIEQALAQDSNATGYGAFSGRLLLAWAARDLGDTAVSRRMFADAQRLFLGMSAAGNDQSMSLLRLYALQGRVGEAVALLKTMPVANLYGGPNDNDGSLISLRGVPEYEAFMARRRDRVRARRKVLGWR